MANDKCYIVGNHSFPLSVKELNSLKKLKEAYPKVNAAILKALLKQIRNK